MSRDRPTLTGWSGNLEAARRRVNQIEIEACRIRTDLAQLEVANATGVVPDAIAPDIEQPVARSAILERPLDWQPAAELIPDGMEILVGATPAVEAPIAAENSEEIAAEPVPASESWVSGSGQSVAWNVSPDDFTCHGKPHRPCGGNDSCRVDHGSHHRRKLMRGSTTTTLVLGEKPSKEVGEL